MKRIINTTDAPAPIGPYSQAVLANGFLYVSGQIPINPATGELTMDSIKSETEQVMRNLNAVLLEAGFEFSDILKTTIFLSDMSLFAEVNDVYGSYFETDFPARETVAVKGLPKGVNVEISVVAYKG
ncbi:2-iminobutanoate/2-iminopropanoate deaminase [Pedobacter westerhofensis]|uniref:2-iminobutanoate/2-iminopropanoate deaminase n=1 Tax=Pedobacter westerhofensis TaxID=425512 RepID=A0A521EJS2_9SPHI|nr:RidA family protein [Pedobacter westerhofensis]SMO83701.1 2-iminobutanoate/2-iminopropanoate deaminase [Pedobacter westerhofensis]